MYSNTFFFIVTLKNAAELLEFAALYNADQLKLSCLQFIGLNVAALLEARYICYHLFIVFLNAIISNCFLLESCTFHGKAFSAS